MNKEYSYATVTKIRNILYKKDKLFAIEHARDSDEQLLEYLKVCAEKIGRSPNYCEVIGGNYIAYRFGSWNSALEKIGYRAPGMAPRLENRLIFKEAEQRLREIHREIKAKKAEKRERLAKEQARLREIKRISEEELERREKEFAELHAKDTDEQLLAYLRLCAEQLGRTPYKRDVVGGEYIKERFVLWSVALWQAGLEMPKDMRPPTEKEKHQYENGSLRRIHEAKVRRAMEKMKNKNKK